LVPTLPCEWADARIRSSAPEIFASESIRNRRLKQSLGRTWLRRPELLESLALTDEQAVLLAEFQREHQARQQDYEGNV
jgi:tRNA G37 N-methylase TrmD